MNTDLTYLRHYAAAISRTEKSLVRLEQQQIRPLSDTVSQWLSRIDAEIANDGTLKNDAQRKAKRIELTSDPEYQALSEQLRQLKYKAELKRIKLGEQSRFFSVAKLEARHQIAQMEALTA